MPSTFDITCLVGLSESELLTIRSSIVSSLTTSMPGTDVTSFSTMYLSTTTQIRVSPEVMLQAVNYALWKLDPDSYDQPESSKVHRYYTL